MPDLDGIFEGVNGRLELVAAGELQKRSLQMPVIREVVVEAKCQLIVVAEDHVAERRYRALQTREVLAVVADLHEIVRLGR